MANKIFSNYIHQKDYSGTNADNLVIEIGNTHFACVLADAHTNSITALEWFKHDKLEQAAFEDLFDNIKSGSRLLGNQFSNTKIYINNGYSVVIPPELFNENTADDFLNIVAGEPINSRSFFDEISSNEKYMLGYRIPAHILAVLNNQLSFNKIEHTFSQTLRQLLLSTLPTECMYVQFYDSEIVVIIFKDGKLQFMQAFSYNMADDVLYYLLSLVQRLQLHKEVVVLKVSGMIDTHSNLYVQLLKFFGNVSTHQQMNRQVHFDLNDYPAHYFTPIYNLAL